MSIVSIGQRIVTVAGVIVGVAAGVGTLAAVDAQPAASAAPATAQRVETLAVTPDPSVPYVLTCRTESGPADGDFRWQVCVPDESPDGAPVEAIAEDGEASYRDGWSLAPTEQPPAGGDTVKGEWTAARDSAPVRTVAHTTPQPRPAAGSCSEPVPTPRGGKPSTTPAPTTPPTTTPLRPLVNVNTASVAELDALPGIGTVLAARIVELRPYRSVDDLHRVSRIPAKVFPLVTV